MDNNIYENGWNDTNSYIFGWIMSDGCLKKEGRNKTAYAIRICSNDYDIISWIHNVMCVGNKIYKQGQNGFQIKYRNVDGIQFLIDNGLTERKSLTASFPNLPYKNIRHFIRGYFDGNGSVVLRTNQYNTYCQIRFTSGSIMFLEKLKNILHDSGIMSQIYLDGRSTNKSCYLAITKRSEIEKMYHFMYDDIKGEELLRRKYDKYNEYLDCKPKYNIVKTA